MRMKVCRSHYLEAAIYPLIIIIISACAPSDIAPPTRYERADLKWGKQFGYRDQKISSNEYSVIVKGNPNTDAQSVADLALLRAAHITQDNGAEYFVVKDAKVSVLGSDETVSAPLLGLFIWSPVGRRATEEPQAVLLFEIVRNDREDKKQYIEAKSVIRKLSGKYSK